MITVTYPSYWEDPHPFARSIVRAIKNCDKNGDEELKGWFVRLMKGTTTYSIDDGKPERIERRFATVAEFLEWEETSPEAEFIRQYHMRERRERLPCLMCGAKEVGQRSKAEFFCGWECWVHHLNSTGKERAERCLRMEKRRVARLRRRVALLPRSPSKD